MAERRMFAKSILLSDQFLDLSKGARTLYCTLCMAADDDGLTGGVKSLLRQSGCTARELRELVDAKYLISFPSGVYAIADWRVHNTIRKDRYNPTLHTAELAALECTEGGRYVKSRTKRQPSGNHVATDGQPNDNQTATDWQPNDNQTATDWQPNGNPDKVRLDQDRLGQVSVCQDAAGGGHTHTGACKKRLYGSFQNVRLSDPEYQALQSRFPDLPERIEAFSRALEKYGYRYNSHALALEDFSLDDLQAAERATASGTCASTFVTDEFFAAALKHYAPNES